MNGFGASQQSNITISFAIGIIFAMAKEAFGGLKAYVTLNILDTFMFSRLTSKL